MKHSMTTTHPSPLMEGPYTCNLQFANNKDLMSSSSGELQDVTNRLMDRATANGMEVSTEKSKIMTSSTNNIKADVSTNGQKSEEVTSFKHWEQPCTRMAPAQQKSTS